MSEIKTLLDSQQDLTVHTVFGYLTSQEILDKLEFCSKGVPTKLILWDLTNGSWARISSDELRGIVGRANKYSRKKRARMAWVFSKSVDFGLGRMFGAFAEHDGAEFESGCFQNRRDADSWLGIFREE